MKSKGQKPHKDVELPCNYDNAVIIDVFTEYKVKCSRDSDGWSGIKRYRKYNNGDVYVLTPYFAGDPE